MDSSKFNMYKSAADISNLVMKKAIELCHQKMKASYICTFCDSLINEKLNLSCILIFNPRTIIIKILYDQLDLV